MMKSLLFLALVSLLALDAPAQTQAMLNDADMSASLDAVETRLDVESGRTAAIAAPVRVDLSEALDRSRSSPDNLTLTAGLLRLQLNNVFIFSERRAARLLGDKVLTPRDVLNKSILSTRGGDGFEASAGFRTHALDGAQNQVDLHLDRIVTVPSERPPGIILKF